MKRQSTVFFPVVLCALCVLNIAAQDKEWGSFDRLLAAQYFLDAVYPDLRHYEGLLTLRAVEFRTATGQGNVVDLVPCKPGSGIVTYSNVEPGWQPPPNCGDGRYLGNPSNFLSMDVTFGAKYPIRDFGALGSFVHAKSNPVEKQIAAHPEWSDKQKFDAVRQANPRFGPDKKPQFLKAVPVDAIFKFTGCRLQLDTAQFLAVRQELGDRDRSARGEIGWRISGLRRNERTDEEVNCVARFEPFDGNLIYLGSF